MSCHRATYHTEREKGFAPLIIILGMVIVLGIIGGIYSLGKAKSTNTKESANIAVSPSPTSSVEYSSTTLGFKLTLPHGWTVCDPGYTPGVIGLQPQKIPSNQCSAYTITTARYYILPGNPSVERKPTESFSSYIKRLDAAYMKQVQVIKSNNSKPKVEFKDTDAHTVLKKITTRYPQNLPVGTKRQVLYIEDSEKTALIISSNYGNFASTEDDTNLQLIASHLTSIPISTGDISGQVNSVGVNNNPGNNTLLPNFPITIYTDFTDTKTIAATTKSDEAAMFIVHLKPGTYYTKYPNGIWQQIIVSLGSITHFNPGITPESTPNPLTPFVNRI